MNRRPGAGTTLLVALALGAGSAGAQQEAVAPLSWMAGCWRADAGNGWSEEVWTAPAGGLLLGLSRSISAGGGVAFEYMRIEAGDEGVVLHASPGGGAATAFPAVTIDDERFRAERPEHDFPRAIEYRRRGADSLVARVFARVTDDEPAFVLRFARSGCPGGAG